MTKTGFVLLISVCSMIAGVSVSAVDFWVDAESGIALTGYNDVQIPADTGTRFSLADDLSPAPTVFLRLQAGVDAERHSVLLLYAPLLVESSGKVGRDIDFYGETFPAGTELTGKFRFNSYRLTYAYTFLKRPALDIAAGLTGKIRDAYISLEGGGSSAKRTDLGFVPLIHLKVAWEFAAPFGLLLEGDGLAAPQGRAEDFLLALRYSPQPRLTLRLGYRVLEGGSDGGGSVYTFSMFHYVSAGARWTF